ncbi:hypothetical protein ACQP1O_19325 [Nocardia sp. CA-151230]|uniref:hypothetical protein n=1 Tax=Nocardia sp. CA-151230 TaxID=3239982 RepID=UPI003D901A6A
MSETTPQHPATTPDPAAATPPPPRGDDSGRTGRIDREPGAPAAHVLAAVTELAPLVREQAAACDRDRSLPRPVLDALVETGLFTLLDPHDGETARLLDFFAAVRTIASASASVGWVAAMLGTAAWHVLAMDPATRQEVRGSAQTALVSVSHAPMGRLTPTDGGYVLDGEWPNLPAVDHCDWAVLTALTARAETTPRRTNPVRVATAVVPRAQLLDGADWNTIGLRGTGSKRVSARQVFVPGHRVRRSPQPGDIAGHAVPRCPLTIVYSMAACMPVLGAAQGAFDGYLARTERRVALSLAGAQSVLDPAIQAAVARGLAEIDASILQLERDLRDTSSTVAQAIPVGTELLLRTRRDQVRATERAVAALELLRRMAGGEAVREGGAIDRAWRDVNTAAAHVINQPEPALRLYGQWAFGLDVDNEMVTI